VINHKIKEAIKSKSNNFPEKGEPRYFLHQFYTSINYPLLPGFNRTHLRVGFEDDALVFDTTLVPSDVIEGWSRVYIDELVKTASEEDDIFSFQYLKQLLAREIENIGSQASWS